MVRRFFRALEIEPELKSGGRAARLILTETTAGAKGFALGVNINQPGQIPPPHAHETEQEAMYIVSGKGKAIVGEEEFDVEPDTVVFAPAGVSHQFIPIGDEPLKIIWVFSPPLPEQK